MSKKIQLLECINSLKEIRLILSDDTSLKVAAHCIDMAVLEISQIADTKIIKNERMMLEYLELSELDTAPEIYLSNMNENTA